MNMDSVLPQPVPQLATPHALLLRYCSGAWQPPSQHGNLSGEKLLTGVITHCCGEAQGLVMHWDAAWVSRRAGDAPGAHRSQEVIAVVPLALAAC